MQAELLNEQGQEAGKVCCAVFTGHSESVNGGAPVGACRAITGVGYRTDHTLGVCMVAKATAEHGQRVRIWLLVEQRRLVWVS